MNVTIRMLAREDILRQYEWYLTQAGDEIAQRFLDAVEAAVNLLRRSPDIGSPRAFRNPRLAGLRSWPIPGFAAVRIYYIHAGEGLRVIPLLHGKRDVQSLLEADEQSE